MKYASNALIKKTLDIQHNMKLTHFQEREERIHRLRRELDQIESKIQEQRLSTFQDANSEVSDHLLEEYLSYIDEKKNIELELNALENSTEEIDYYVNTSPLLFQYYDLVDKGVNDNMSSNTCVKDKSILKYFVNSSCDTEDKNNQLPTQVDDKATLLDKYLAFTDSNYMKNVTPECKDTCQSCGSSNRNVMVNDGLVFCNDCHTIEYVIVDHERPSYRDPPKEISYFAYKRINHFQEYIIL